MPTPNPPLKGMSAVSAIVTGAAAYDVDPRALIANAILSGGGGEIGDNGLGYGPFLMHLTALEASPMRGKGAHNVKVNAWAWTQNGIEYAVRYIASGTPRGKALHGHPAVYAIIKAKDRPVDLHAAYTLGVKEYDKLASLGPGWAAYAAGKLKGPAAGGAVDTVPGAGPSVGAYHPAGVVTQWRAFVDVFKVSLPKQHQGVKSAFDTPKELFK